MTQPFFEGESREAVTCLHWLCRKCALLTSVLRLASAASY